MSRFEAYGQIEFQPLEILLAEQDRQLRRHLEYCAAHSPYYREKLAGLDLSTVPLQELPVTDKEQVSLHNEELIAVALDRIVDIVFSSGTIGIPTKVVYTEGDLERLAYNEKQSFESCGVVKSDVVLLTCTMDRCFIAGLAYFLGVRAIGAAAIRNGHGTLESHSDVIRRSNPTVVIGVPSFLRKLGEYLVEQGVDLQASAVGKLVCIGEPLRDAEMRMNKTALELEAIWGAKVYSTYASSETVTTFCECTAQRGGHLHPELALVEILDDSGAPVADGETGEIVVTPLGIEGMPLIRYRTGDLGFLETQPCACGRNTPRLGPILGRKRQMLKIQGTSLYPQAVYSALDDIPQVKEYFLKVRTTGSSLSDHLAIHLSVAGEAVDGAAIERLLQARLRVTPEVVIQPHSEICRTVFSPQSRKPIRFIDLRS
jgi:phenylacetate-CoA ligase